MPGIWPGAGLRAYKDGSYIDVYTNWGDGGTTVDGRSTVEAAAGICNAAWGDFGYTEPLSITVYAANGWEHLAFKPTGGHCHTW
jgi:hypothetical protein